MANKMADEASRSGCLVVLCGLPACGKTSLANNLTQWNRDHSPTDLHVIHVCFDDYIPANLNLLKRGEVVDSEEKDMSCDGETHPWKMHRKLILQRIERLLICIQNGYFIPSSSRAHVEGDTKKMACSDNKIDHTSPDLLEDFSETFWKMMREKGCHCFNNNDTSRSSSDGCLHIVIIDDNMFYRSMRYEYLQLARKYGLGYVQVYISCPVDRAIQRNSLREPATVTRETIVTMATKLELPNPDKYPWEHNSITIDGLQSSQGDIEILMTLIVKAASNPVLPLIEDDEEQKDELRAANLASVIHQADQVLRKIISKQMEHAKAKGLDKKELQQTAHQLNRNRKCLLENLKKTNSQQYHVPNMENKESDRWKENLGNGPMMYSSDENELSCQLHGGRCSLQMHLYKLMETSREEFEYHIKKLYADYSQ